jgi:NodT family efflux transporter outer membrane factor (OMF) lipoprotein
MLVRSDRRAALMLGISAVVSLAGCAVGPDFKRPDPPQAGRYTPEPLVREIGGAMDIPGGEAQRFVEETDVPAQWWTLFRSEPLNSLVEQSLKSNPGLQAAQAALHVAEENYYAQRGALLPAAEASFSSARQKISSAVASPINSNASMFNLHTAQVTVSYAPDVFGGIRRQVETAKALAEGERYQLEATYLTLTSNVVAGAVQEAALRAQAGAAEEILRIEAGQLDLMQKQLALGAIAEISVIAQRAVLAQTQASLATVRKQLAQQRNLLTALAGRFPSEEVAQKFDLANIRLPAELPLSIPSRLVEQRPDVRAAEEQLHAASAQVGVATANLLPQFPVTANVGSVASELASLFSPATAFWTIAASVSQPIFQGGALVHRKRAAEAAYDQAAAQYRGTVIAALQNVADTLRALQYDGQGLKAALEARTTAAESLAIARRQLELGDISYLALLAAEQTYQQTVIALVQAQASRYSDTAALFQALGGGWWNR